MKRLAILAVTLLVAGYSFGQTVVGTVHDFSDAQTTNTCIFCHTPHQNAAAASQDPLWNHTLSTYAGTYGVYASNTLDADMSSAELGAATAGSATASHLCLSCHDGTVAPSSLYKDPTSGAPTAITAIGSGDSAYVGTNLTDDHPINFTYDAGLAGTDGGLNTPNSTSWVDVGQTVPLFAGTVQCASCHDPHTDQFGAFLVKTNAASALCTTCHTK